MKRKVVDTRSIPTCLVARAVILAKSGRAVRAREWRVTQTNTVDTFALIIAVQLLLYVQGVYVDVNERVVAIFVLATVAVVSVVASASP